MFGVYGLIHNPFPHAPQQRRRGLGFKNNHSILVLSRVNTRTGLQKGQRLSLFLWNSKVNPAGTIFFKHGVHPFGNAVKPTPFTAETWIVWCYHANPSHEGRCAEATPAASVIEGQFYSSPEGVASYPLPVP